MMKGRGKCPECSGLSESIHFIDCRDVDAVVLVQDDSTSLVVFSSSPV